MLHNSVNLLRRRARLPGRARRMAPGWTKALRPPPRPAHTYAEALARIEQLQAADTDEVNPLCRTQALLHGDRRERTIIFLHGYTNCPRQFHLLAEQFHARGYNVLVPRIPYNGLADRMTEAHGQLTAEDLVELTSEAVDIARGLGDHITLVGLSMGGVMAAWAAQQRADLDRVVLIAPGLWVAGVPIALAPAIHRLAPRIPNLFLWWDAKQKEAGDGPAHAYPRLATRAIAQMLRLGVAIHAWARIMPPAAESVVVVTNGNDQAVHNDVTDRVATDWQTHAGVSVERYHFDPSLGLNHDLIDPAQTNQRTDLVYPILTALIVGTSSEAR